MNTTTNKIENLIAEIFLWTVGDASAFEQEQDMNELFSEAMFNSRIEVIKELQNCLAINNK
jgi:hypothetical protein